MEPPPSPETKDPTGFVERETVAWRYKLRSILMKMLFFLHLPSLVVGMFVAKDFPIVQNFTSWLLLFIPLMLPISVNAQFAVANVGLMLMFFYTGFSTTGIFAFSMANPALAPIYAAAVGGAFASGVVVGILELCYVVFLYLYHNGQVERALVTILGHAPGYWVCNTVIHATLFPYLVMRLLQPMLDLRDQTRRRKKASEELYKANRHIQQSLARYSHEIRTPLNVLCAVAEEIHRTPTPQSVQTDLMLLRSTSHWLLALANNVLDVSAIEVGALKIKKQPFSLKSMVEGVTAAAEFAATLKRMRFSHQINSGVPQVVIGDQGRMQQMLRILFAFVFQNAHQGDVTLVVSKEQVRRHSGSSDSTSGSSGSRASVEQVNIVFYITAPVGLGAQPLLQKGLAGKQQVNTGVCVVEKLVDLMGGSFQELRTEDSSIFRLTCKLGVPTNQALPARSLKILYADDEPTNTYVLSLYLRGTPHKMETVEDGEKAYLSFQATNYDCVILDLQMPKMTGFEAALAMRRYELLNGLSHTPMVLLTAHVAEGLEEEAASNGIDMVLTKPISADAFRRALDDICNHHVEIPTINQISTGAMSFAMMTTTDPSPPPSASISGSATTSNSSSEVSPVSSRPSTPRSGSSSIRSEFKHLATPRVEFARDADLSDGDSLKDEDEKEDLVDSSSPDYNPRPYNVKLWVWRPESMDLFERWKYRSCLFVVTLNLALCIVILFSQRSSAALHFINVRMFVLLTLALLPFPVLMRVSPKLLLLLWMWIVQFVYTDISLNHSSLPIEPGVVMSLNVIAGAPMWTGFVSAFMLLAQAGVFIYSHYGFQLHWYTASLTDCLNFSLIQAYLVTVSAVFVYFSMASRTITIRKMERAGKKAEHALVTVAAKKASAEEFIQALSYDLRTPLNVVLGVSERLSEMSSLPKTTLMHVTTIRSAAHILLNMIWNMLDTRAMQAGEGLQATSVPLSIRELASRIAHVMSFTAGQRGLRLLVCISPNIPDCVKADPVRMQQGLMNLIGNSLKYCEKGTVMLSVDTVSFPDPGEASRATLDSVLEEIKSIPSTTDETTSIQFSYTSPIGREKEPRTLFIPGTTCYLRFRVTDTGKGMDPETHKKLTTTVPDMLPLSHAVLHNGGYGFRITQAIISQLEGKMAVSTALGVGTCVSVVIPLIVAVPQTSPTAARRISSPTKPARPLRILIVEDVAEMQYVLRLYLQDTPHVSDIAYTGEQAVQLFQDTEYDVVLLDLCLVPSMTGVDVLKTIREIEKARPSRIACVVIVLTAAILTNERQETTRLGANFFEPKPITRARLLEHLQKIMEDRTPPGSPRVLKPKTALDVDELVAVLQQQSASMALTSSTPLRQVNPLEASEWQVKIPAKEYDYVRLQYLPKLREAIQSLSVMLLKDDFVSLRNEIFRIRNTANRFGFDRVTDTCKRIEALTVTNDPDTSEVLQYIDELQDDMAALRVVCDEQK